MKDAEARLVDGLNDFADGLEVERMQQRLDNLLSALHSIKSETKCSAALRMAIMAISHDLAVANAPGH